MVIECVYGVLMFGSKMLIESVICGASGYDGVSLNGGTTATAAASRKSSGTGPSVPFDVDRVVVSVAPGLPEYTPAKSPIPLRLYASPYAARMTVSPSSPIRRPSTPPFFDGLQAAPTDGAKLL